jgi:hypothetical protein
MKKQAENGHGCAETLLKKDHPAPALASHFAPAQERASGYLFYRGVADLCNKGDFSAWRRQPI